MRLQALDIARFLAFCGMVLVNFRLAANVTPGDDWFSVLTNVLEGRSAALFVVLAGVGIALAKPQTDLFLRRAAFLFVLGLANSIVFDADILHFYALYFIAAIPFVTTENRWLWLGISSFMVISLIAQVTLDYDVGWNWITNQYSDFWTLKGFLRHSFYNGWHPVFPWVSFLLFGMWIGRQDLSASVIHNRMIVWGSIFAAVAVIPGWFVQDPELLYLADTNSVPPGPFYLIASSGSAVAVIGLVFKIEPTLSHLGLTQWLTAPGRLALTLYVAHIYLGIGILDELGRLDGSLSQLQIFVISLIFCAACSLYARLWRIHFKRGPLETLMRWVTEKGH